MTKNDLDIYDGNKITNFSSNEKKDINIGKDFCHEFMENHYLYHLIFGSTIEILKPHENTLAHVITKCGMFRGSISEAKRNGWNNPIPNGYSSYKKKKNEKMDTIGILWLPIEYDMKEEIDWFLQEKDILEFSRFVYYFIGLEMKKWNYYIDDVPTANDQKYFDDLRILGDFLFSYEGKDNMLMDIHRILNLNMDLVSKFLSGDVITRIESQKWINLY